jgi:sterol desaturase/sphingolipid hydroxylase (fatty acid hydroxylase superfamily)
MLFALVSIHWFECATAFGCYAIILTFMYLRHLRAVPHQRHFTWGGNFRADPETRPSFRTTLGVLSPLFLIKGSGIVTPLLLAIAFFRLEGDGLSGDRLHSAVILISSLQIAILWVTHDFANFLQHLAQHRSNILWRYHSVHHSAEQLSPFTQLLGHPIDLIVATAISFPIVFLGSIIALAMGDWTIHQAVWGFIPVLIIIEHLKGALGHSHLSITFGKWNRLVLSPVMHQIHHSAETRHRGVNFGSTFGLWDWMFGTFYEPPPGEAYRLGLDEFQLGENNPYRTVRSLYLAAPKGDLTHLER